MDRMLGIDRFLCVTLLTPEVVAVGVGGTGEDDSKALVAVAAGSTTGCEGCHCFFSF